MGHTCFVATVLFCVQLPFYCGFFSSVFRTLSCSLWANRRVVGMPWVKSIVFFLTSVCLPQCTLTSSFNVLSILILLTSLLSSLSSTIYSESCWEVNEPVYEVTENNFLALSIYEFYLLFHLPIPPPRVRTYLTGSVTICLFTLLLKKMFHDYL